MFGWILYPQIHGPVCFGIIVHWLINKGRCVFSGNYSDDNGFTTDILMKVGIDISGKEWLKKLVPYLLVLIPGLVSVFMSIRDIAFFGDVVGLNTGIVMAGGAVLLSIWRAVQQILGLTSAAEAPVAVANATPTETAATVTAAPATADAPTADAPTADA